MKKIIPVLMSLMLLGGCGAGEEKPGYRQINAEEAAAMMEKESGYVILDVRTAQEYRDRHIPGAINIDVNSSDFAERCLKVLKRGETAAVYCRSGRRSKNAANILSAKWASIIELNGGFLSWTSDIEK